MASYKIEEIEGIGPVTGEKFRACEIHNTDTLLTNGKTSAQRKDLSARTGVSESQILKYVNMADLFRISGVGSEFAELLEAAGVDTVRELAQRNAENLAKKMAEVNETKKLTRRTPTVADVTKWIEQSKSLPHAIEY
jgi:predicted flap endonuclease-1-like 5' DNA nuclease